ncbi:MAG: hypothetical protein SO130_01345 [Agathobacter sp.]|nr:hypothetical protein [Agathobacter sp.]
MTIAETGGVHPALHAATEEMIDEMAEEMSAEMTGKDGIGTTAGVIDIMI